MSPLKMLEFTGTLLLKAEARYGYNPESLCMRPGVAILLLTDSGDHINAIQFFDDMRLAKTFQSGLRRGARLTVSMPARHCEVRGIATSITTHTPLPTQPAAPSFHEPAEHEEAIQPLLN